MMNPKVKMGVSKAFINNSGVLVEIVSARNVNINPIFKDSNGNEYDFTGMSITQRDEENRFDIQDKAMKVGVGDVYDFHWKDRQSVGRYCVTAVDDKGYEIIWSNSVANRIQYGCPLNYDAKRVSHGPGSSKPEVYTFKSGWSAKREYGLMPAPGETDYFSVSGIFVMGKWVLRNDKGDYVDMDTHSTDLFDRYPECEGWEDQVFGDKVLDVQPGTGKTLTGA
jgi:hypothetical protein